MVEEIKKLCKENATTIKALERELGLGNGTIRRWDNSPPSIEKILKVAERFNCSVEDLTGGGTINSVDKVKSICKERKIPISKLEKDLGFSNGYISQLKKGVFPADRLIAISDYLNVSIFDLTGGDKQELAADALTKLQGNMSKQAETFEEIRDLQIDLLNATLDQLKEALAGLDTGSKFDLAMFLLNDVKGNENK